MSPPKTGSLRPRRRGPDQKSLSAIDVSSVAGKEDTKLARASIMARISAEVEKQLEQHSVFHSVGQQSLAGEQAEHVEQTR